MADLTGADPANLQSETLRSALTVELPPLWPSDPPGAMAPPAAVLSIDRLEGRHPLRTASHADAELTPIARERALRLRLLRLQQGKVTERLSNPLETPCDPPEPDAVRHAV